jgi:hypothetical protein
MDVIERFVLGALIVGIPLLLAFVLGLCWQVFRIGAGW